MDIDPKKVEKLAEALSDEIGAAVEELVPVARMLIHQMQLRGVVTVVIGFVVCVGFSTFLYWSAGRALDRSREAEEDEAQDEEPWHVLSVGLYFFSFFSCLIGFVMMCDGAYDIVAPLLQLVGK